MITTIPCVVMMEWIVLWARKHAPHHLVMAPILSKEVSLQSFDCLVTTVIAGDGFCDSILNIPECNFDEGDCTLANICNRDCSQHFNGGMENVDQLIQDSVCQSELSIEECCYDGGDCGCPRCKCPTCPDLLQSIHNWLGDGVCDSVLDSRDCCYDLGDCWCTSCLATSGDRYNRSHNRIGDLNCDQVLNHDDCCFDFGDCDIDRCMTCPIWHEGLLDDGLCDKHLFNQACCFDGSDCDGMDLACPTCQLGNYARRSQRIGNRQCDENANNEECCFDQGDCTVFDNLCSECVHLLDTEYFLTVSKFL